jgi:hypothetical protein
MFMAAPPALVARFAGYKGCQNNVPRLAWCNHFPVNREKAIGKVDISPAPWYMKRPAGTETYNRAAAESTQR